MANTVKLSKNLLNIIARDAAVFLPAVGIKMTEIENPEIGESFVVWSLPASAVVQDNPLKQAISTGKLHHQIYRKGEPNAFAYSQSFGPHEDNWKVTAAFESKIPYYIDLAIDIVDQQLPEDADVRLLILPAYNMQALWVITNKQEDYIIPCVVPDEYKESIQIRVYKATDFFLALRKVHQVIGIRF